MRTFWEANAHNKAEKLNIYIKYLQIKLFSTYLIILRLYGMVHWMTAGEGYYLYCATFTI